MTQRLLKRTTGAVLGTLLACVGLTAHAQVPAPLANEVRLVNCDAPATFAEANACNAAKSGVDALRRYVEMTRPFHQFTMAQFANLRFPAVAQSQPVEAEATRLAGSTR